MKLRSLFITIAIGTATGLTIAPVQAQTVDPCTIYMCMAGISGAGASGGPACTPALTYWHSPAPAGLAVYHPPQGFNPPASAGLRRGYLSSCKGAKVATNAAILETIISEHGYLP